MFHLCTRFIPAFSVAEYSFSSCLVQSCLCLDSSCFRKIVPIRKSKQLMNLQITQLFWCPNITDRKRMFLYLFETQARCIGQSICCGDCKLWAKKINFELFSFAEAVFV